MKYLPFLSTLLYAVTLFFSYQQDVDITILVFLALLWIETRFLFLVAAKTLGVLHDLLCAIEVAMK